MKIIYRSVEIKERTEKQQAAIDRKKDRKRKTITSPNDDFDIWEFDQEFIQEF